MDEKLTDLRDAVAAHVRDGVSIALGACLEPDIPFAAAHEIIRQERRDLNLIAPISDGSTDLLIGAGCCTRVTGAWVGNVSGGLGHNYRRAVEKGIPHAIKVSDHSNFSLGMALMAGAYGMPYAPTRTLVGSDILKSNPGLVQSENPFSETHEPIVLVPPLQPDVAVLTVQRADRFGNNHHWGSRGLVRESALAAEKVILLADEIVDEDVILSDPSRVLVPGYLVTAVCHVPAAVHPAPMTGRWQRDTEFFNDYHTRSRARDGFLEWLDEWVLGVADHAAYREKLGARLGEIKVSGSAPAAITDYAAA